MREMTTRAKGTQLKGGAVRRIAVTMDESMFLELRELAVTYDRSISTQIVRILRATLNRQRVARAGKASLSGGHGQGAA